MWQDPPLPAGDVASVRDCSVRKVKATWGFRHGKSEVDGGGHGRLTTGGNTGVSTDERSIRSSDRKQKGDKRNIRRVRTVETLGIILLHYRNRHHRPSHTEFGSPMFFRSISDDPFVIGLTLGKTSGVWSPVPGCREKKLRPLLEYS